MVVVVAVRFVHESMRTAVASAAAMMLGFVVLFHSPTSRDLCKGGRKCVWVCWIYIIYLRSLSDVLRDSLH